MEESSRRSVERSGIVLKKRSSSGCLIVRKKGDGVGGGSGVGPSQRKRPRMIMSDSGSSDELSVVRPRRLPVGAETIRVCSGLAAPRKGISEVNVGVGRNGEENRKRSRLDVFEFDEYDGIGGEGMGMGGRQFDDVGIELSRRRFLGSPPVARSGSSRDFASGSSRQNVVERRKNMYIDEMSGGLGREDGGGKNRFQMKREGGRIPIQMLREKYGGRPDEAIRVQGKNGVLKVLVNPRKNLAGAVRNLDRWDERRKVPVAEGRKGSIPEDIIHNVTSHATAFAETRRNEMRIPLPKTEKNNLNVQKPVSAKINKPDEWESGDSDMSPTPSRRNADVRDSVTRVSCKKEKSPQSKVGRDREKSPQLKIGRRKGKPRQAKMSREKEKSPQPKVVARAKSPETPVLAGPKEAKVKRGSGTEKQKLRERIREMLLNAGWTIDYRPRRNRDYLDAVYINPAGTAYWSIIKAYDALQKQLDDDDDEGKAGGERSAFVISDDTLGQLTRKTQKKMEKEMKMKEREGAGSANARQVARRNSKPKNEEESLDSDSEEEKLSSFIKQGGKSLKKGPVHHLHSSTDKGTSVPNIHQVHGRKGRCTLLVRSSDKGLNSESDGFVPYTGKRTLLSWLIDSGVVEQSQKVQYMNRRKTRVLLEGWVTRDGIHCGCCSKILTLSKFEIHAGSKLRQPFQNIHLESGVSLLQCQIDAWNKQEESERRGFHSVDAEGDDPNDDTCGLCGDGGDLICCDGCPSTFHQSCLNIQKLPPGDWHCPNCKCKYCGIASEYTSHVDNASVSEIFACELCEKKYHKSCLEKADTFPWDSNSSIHSFCSLKCAELFEHLQKYLGAKHEVEGGFSWSLIRRTDAESEMSLRGLPQRVECNSKLAVALKIMDECFLPIVDRRSGINMIHNVLYNCGSNFNRINYSGFYTAILERGDEIICAASLRFHGTQLAEMPFIGTRHIYRRQGMCRRLFSAIESALRSLKVEVLIIPAISELMHTWTVAFGFSLLKESLKQDMRSLNMLVFPGLDMLQKLLLEQDSFAGSRDAKPMELQMDKQVTTPESDDFSQHDDPGNYSGKEGDKADIMDCDPKSQDVSMGNASTGNGSSHDTSDDVELRVSGERFKDSDSDLADKSAESDIDHVCSAPCDAEIDACKVEDNSMPSLPSQVGVQSNAEDCYANDSPETEAGAACKNGSPHAASICDSCATNGSHMRPLLSSVSHNKSGMDGRSMSDSCVAGNFQNSGSLTNVNEEQRDISADNVIEGADVKSRDDPSIHESKENVVLLNSNADNQISNGKENMIEFNDELFSHADVEMENKSLLSFPSKGESLNETHWGSCRVRSQYDNADSDVNVTLVEPLATSEEKQDIEIWEEENAEDAPVSTVVSIQALEEAEDLRKDITMEENCQDGSVSDVN